MEEHHKLRIDIWLHCARLFKSRTQATDACRDSRIMINEKFVDASHTVTEGDRVKIRVSGMYREYHVLEVANINLSKKEAPRMYEETTSLDTIEKFRQVSEAKQIWRDNKADGPRPTKKIRRDMEKFRKK
jgi:ribosome-associated heat shock protein Hsp15